MVYYPYYEDIEMSVKQVIIMRKDLNMRKGKMIAQACHATMKNLLDHSYTNIDLSIAPFLSIELDDDVREWLQSGFTKICLYVDSEADLYTAYQVARDAGLRVSMIEDNGTTEFNGVKTNTCIAIGPNKSDEINIVTGHLKLL